MANKVERFTKSILEQPQLVSLEKFNEISEYLDERNSGTYEDTIEKASLIEEESLSERNVVEGSTGFLKIHGSLVDKKSPINALCGLTAYRQLLEDMDYICSFDNVKTIVMDIDSGGGLAYNMKNTSEQLRAKADKHGKRLIGYVDGQACSAAFGLASACHELISHPDASTGSIGVLIQLQSLDPDEPAPVFITAGKSKIPFDKEGNYSESFLTDLQEKVNETYDSFVTLVANQRGLSKESVMNTEAKVFKSNKALELGLIDKIMTPEEFNNYLFDMNDGETTSPQHTGTTSQQVAAKTNVAETQLNNKGKTTMSELTPELEAKLAKLAEMEEQLAAFQAKEVEAKTNKIKESLSAFTFLSEDTQASLQGVLLQGGEQAGLLNSVLEQANSGIESAVEVAKAESAEKLAELSTQVEEANSKVETLTAEMGTVKKEFGSQKAVEGTVDKTELTTGADEASKLAAKVAKKLSQKL